MRPWQPELQRLCCHFVFESDEPSDLLKSYSFEMQTTRQCRCPLTGQFNHYYLPAARLLSSNGWRKTVYLERCCFGEVGGSTAACTLTSSTVTCTTSIFVSAVQQWELGAAKTKS